MTKRTKLKVEKAQLYMTKNVFNRRFIVRNILVATAAVTAVAAVVGTGFFIKESKASKKAEAQAYVDREVVLSVAETPMLETEGFTVLAAGLDNKTDIKANDAQMVAAADTFAGKGAAADDGVLIRSSASFDGVVIGKMDKGAVADVKSKNGDWIKISSGDITGYVVENQLAYGQEGYALAQAAYQVLGVISEDDVCVRVAASMDSDQVEMADKNDKYEVDKENTDKDWVCVTTLTTGGVGYIRAQFVRVTEGYLTAYATDEGEAALTATGDIEKIGTVTAETTEDDTTTDTTTEATKPSEDEKKPASNVQPPVITQSGSVALSDADINLMAAIMTMECGGESYEGQLAVANVILNRLRSGAYGSTISDVVYAPGQFEVAGSSALEGYIACPQSSCVQAAREAASGVNNIGGMMCFGPTWALDASSLGNCIQIGNHLFY